MALRGVRDLKYLSWCVVGAQLFARCSKRQYMSVIVDTEGNIIGTGYNGAPPGMPHCTDGFCPRAIEGSAPGSSYDNCVSNHSETNAIARSDVQARRGATIYVNGPPCFTCAKLIAGSGIRRVVHIKDPSYEQWPEIEAFLRNARLDVTGVDKETCLDTVGTLVL